MIPEDKDVNVLAWLLVIDDAIEVSLIKSLLSNDGDARVLLFDMGVVMSIDDKDGEGIGERVKVWWWF